MRSFLFAGVGTNHLSTTDIPTFTTGFNMGAWFYLRDNNSNFSSIFSMSDPTDAYLAHAMVLSGNTVQVTFINNGSAGTAFNSSAIAYGRWYYVGMAYQNSGPTLNGYLFDAAFRPLGTGSTTKAGTFAPTKCYVGTEPNDGDGNMNGYICDVRVWTNTGPFSTAAWRQALHHSPRESVVKHWLTADKGVTGANSGGVSTRWIQTGNVSTSSFVPPMWQPPAPRFADMLAVASDYVVPMQDQARMNMGLYGISGG